MIRRARATRRLLTGPFALAAAAACAGGAWAQDTPYYIGASLAVSHESNVFRSRTDKQSDTITSVGVLGGIDQTFGRQRLYARGSVHHNAYQDLSLLDNVSYTLGAGLQWETIERLSGSFTVGASRSLANETAPDLQPIVVNRKNIENARQLGATVRYGLGPTIGLEAGYTNRRVDYSTVDYIVREHTQDVARIGLRWSRSDLLSLGVGLRYTDIERPNALLAPNIIGPQDSERRDIDFTGVWKPTGRSTLSGRISLTEQEYSTGNTADLSGVTGSLAWAFNPGGRLSFDASIVRDTGTETTFFQFAPDQNPIQVDNARISTQTAIAARYELTAKTVLNARWRHRNSSYASFADDTTDSYALGVRWAATRAITAGCSIARDSRKNAYDADVFSCFGQFVLR